MNLNEMPYEETQKTLQKIYVILGSRLDLGLAEDKETEDHFSDLGKITFYLLTEDFHFGRVVTSNKSEVTKKEVMN